MFERSGFHFFTFRGIALAVSPWYLLLMAFYAFGPMMRAGSGGAGHAFLGGVSAVLAITVSLIVHEFGHGFVAKFYRLNPSILLHGFGGLCTHAIASSDKDDALIVFAGPAVQLVFAGLVVLLSTFVLPLINLGVASGLVASFMSTLWFFSVFWALLNLFLPIWPLDGGQLFHLILRRLMPEERARNIALRVSIFLLIPLAILAFLKAGIFLAILLAYILFYNFQLLNSGQISPGAPPTRAPPRRRPPRSRPSCSKTPSAPWPTRIFAKPTASSTNCAPPGPCPTRCSPRSGRSWRSARFRWSATRKLSPTLSAPRIPRRCARRARLQARIWAEVLARAPEPILTICRAGKDCYRPDDP